jgi:ribosomal protein L13E
MGFGKNNVLPGNHFRKDWQRRVKTWFDQPGRKLRRRNARKAKAATLGVRPLTLLRPAVRGQTVRYNTKIREGRGFTLGELKEAGISRKTALGLGIVVDHRRRNSSVEGKTINIERLKAYKERLVVFPRKAGKPKKGDSSVRCFLFLWVNAGSRNQIKPLSPTTCKLLLLVKPSPSRPPLFLNSLARLPKRSGSSMLTRRFATIGPRQGSRAYARFVQQRLVFTVHFVLSVRSKITVGFQKEEEEAAKKK